MNRLSNIIAFGLATAVSGCGGGDFDALEETTGEAVEALTINEGLLLTFRIGAVGLPASDIDVNVNLFTELRRENDDRGHIGFPRVNNSTRWQANRTYQVELDTAARGVDHPDDIVEFNVLNPESATWDLQGLEIHNIEGGVKSTPRFAHLGTPSNPWIHYNYDTRGGGSVMPTTLLHRPRGSVTGHKDFYATYLDWNDVKQCTRIIDLDIYRAPWASTGCDWMQERRVDYIDYRNWSGSDYRAQVSGTIFRTTPRSAIPIWLPAAYLSYELSETSEWTMMMVP